ncbi:hypothetical protein JZ956_10150, partial [Riemerella anatipestifer]
MKKHLLRLVEIELLVQFSPPFANTFSVARHTTENHTAEIKLNFSVIKETESKPNKENVERFEFI